MLRLNILSIFLISTFAVGQTVSVGAPSSVQSGTTTTITVPVTVTAGTSTVGTAAAALPMLSVDTGSAFGTQQVSTTFTTVAMGNVLVDTANGWNAAANAYTVPNTGTYLIVSKVRLADGTGPGISYGQGVNTANVDGPYFQWATTAGVRSQSLNVRVVKLTAGQTVDLFAYVDKATGTVWTAALTIQELN